MEKKTIPGVPFRDRLMSAAPENLNYRQIWVRYRSLAIIGKIYNSQINYIERMESSYAIKKESLPI